MVARNESMFGCYSDSYSYRLWSLANVWSSCQLPPLPAGSDKPLPSACSSVSDGEDAPPAAAPPGGRGRRSPPLPLGPGGPYTCPQCGGAYPSKELLEKHELLHSPNTQSCKICNKSFANVYRLQRHMISHDESALLRKFKCNDCDKAFKFKHHLKEHLRIHSGEKPFECGNCRKKFSHSGSYSSHMTSKKCLVMNLKMGRIRPNNPALNPVRSPSRKRASSAISQINNNSTPNNNNSYLPILPKYNDATTAFLASLAPRDGFSSSPSPLSNPAFQSLYLSGNIPLHHLGGVPPYNPAITNLLEHFAASQLLPRKLDSDIIHKGSGSSHSDPEDMIEEVTEDEDKRSSIGDERELVMDIEDEEPVRIKEEVEPERIVTPKNLTPSYAERQSPSANSNSGDLGGFKRILDNVNATVTKHMLQVNMNKLSPDCARSCHSIPSPPVPVVPIKPDPDDVLQCTRCHITFNHKAELLQHEQVLCGQLFRKHEGLAAQMAETVALNRIEEEIHASINSGMSGSEDEDYSKDTDGKMRQDNERKVRVRTAISDEQQAILKEHYARNQRPNREEFRRIAQRLGLDNRVVQVWFQNNRARVRRMNQSHTFSEQPLDLSTKKSTNSTTSSPSASPLCNASHSDFGEEAVNLSQKSSRSPTPYRQSFQSHYQHSNCSSSSLADMRHSPSPSEALMMNGPRRLLHSQYKINPNSCHAPPPVYSPDMTASHSPLMNNHLGSDLGRASSSSPGSERRSWTEESRVSQDIDGDEPSLKKVRLKGPGDSKEPEGQFVCDQCDKAFVKQSSLARHKYEHSGQRPYKCVECPKAFKHKHHLTEHKRLHTGEKPFQCCKCLKKFSHSGSYSQHMNHRYSYCKPYRE